MRFSSNPATATHTGSRHGKPVVLIVRALDMRHDGFEFFLSENGGWPTSHVPPGYLEFPGEA